jgi:hypothetical protein
MASYTYQQLSGTGSIGENISSLKTFNFTNPSSGSAYFIMETIPTQGGFFNSSSPTNFIGSYQVTASMGLVTSSYIAAVVVPPRASSFTFTPTSPITGTTYRLKGTGMYSLTIS